MTTTKIQYSKYIIERRAIEKKASALGIKKVMLMTVKRGEVFYTTRAGYYELPSGEVVRGLKRALALVEIGV